MNGGADAIDEIVFTDDMTTLDLAGIRDLLIDQSQTDGDDIISGFNSADTLEGGLGDDVLSGFIGSDTYICNAGDGTDTIEDNGFSNENDTLIIRGYSLADASFSRIGTSNSLEIDFTDAEDGINLINTLNGSGDAIDEIVFADDNITLDNSAVLALLDDDMM